MNALSDQKCFNHAVREAVARCPSCQNFFCRECITEHEGRIACTACLNELVGTDDDAKRTLSFVRPMLLVASSLFLWGLFILFGRVLLLLPDEFHDGSGWAGSVLISPDEDE